MEAVEMNCLRNICGLRRIGRVPNVEIRCGKKSKCEVDNDMFGLIKIVHSYIDIFIFGPKTTIAMVDS